MAARDARELVGVFCGCLGALAFSYHLLPSVFSGPVGTVLAVFAAVSALLIVVQDVQHGEQVFKSVVLLGCYSTLIVVGVTFMIGMLQQAVRAPFHLP